MTPKADDGLADATQPHCPNDDTVMRSVAGGWRCATCGEAVWHDSVCQPPEFDGPDISLR